ncbi:hypothetical protein [Coralliovum pocilloporae]|uniref:hypothetical protein n=1 Tax=Coralliovum pocilloporae TaxID=3066369 RepID=UPI00330795DA
MKFIKHFVASLFIAGLATPSIAKAPDIMPVGEKKILQGYYVWGHEAYSFRQCGETETYWATSPDKLISNVLQHVGEYSTFQRGPYQEFYVEIEAINHGKSADGFAADYPATFEITRILDLSWSPRPGCA